MITRKHFVAIAKALAEVRPIKIPGESTPANITSKQWERDVEAIANALKQTNPLFDFNRFIEACGLKH